jgi:hypothetical protein
MFRLNKILYPSSYQQSQNIIFFLGGLGPQCKSAFESQYSPGCSPRGWKFFNLTEKFAVKTENTADSGLFGFYPCQKENTASETPRV